MTAMSAEIEASAGCVGGTLRRICPLVALTNHYQNPGCALEEALDIVRKMAEEMEEPGE